MENDFHDRKDLTPNVCAVYTEKEYRCKRTAENNTEKTLSACYLGFVTQAISANFAPLLFLTFKDTYGISPKKIAMIPMVFYLSQLIIDLAATKYADKIGYRTCVVASQVLSAVGLVCMTVLLKVIPVPFIGILISVVLYAIGSGLIEVLVSPIVEACPFDNKDGVMSLLHSCSTALGAATEKDAKIIFISEAHEKFYYEK
ncbi:MAG: MFS transporter [Clostridia bacterium]|nr:MFS transporter [Clostridia bacterium]NCC41982.1 MFS transporter [Clostridia bacterium]